jgi:hypothetical protein
MNWQRTVTLGAAGGAIAVWFAGAATSVRPAVDPILSHAATPVELRGAELASEITRLRERLRPSAAPLLRRDLFRYRRGVAATAPPPAAAMALPAGADATRPGSPFSLVGLAEDQGPDGPIRTAIISRGGDLFIVKEGDPVTSQYQVARIAADVVELTDTAAGTPLRLALP